MVMLLVPIAPPHAVQMRSGFDYVTVDSARRRVYAAHTGSSALLVVDADSGKILAQVRVGPLHGVAVDPHSGNVFTGDGTARSVSEVDPVAGRVVASVGVDGPVDAVAYDPVMQRVYADEDDGTRMFVIDAKSMKQIGTVALPGHKPEYLAVDPKTHSIYQNIADLSEVVVIDPRSLEIVRTIPTPEIRLNHPLQIDAELGHLWVGGENGVLATYDLDGHLLAKTAIQPRVDQCNLDQKAHRIACAGGGEVTVVQDGPSDAPHLIARAHVPAGVHTVALDPATGRVWIVYASARGDFIEALSASP